MRTPHSQGTPGAKTLCVEPAFGPRECPTQGTWGGGLRDRHPSGGPLPQRLYTCLCGGMTPEHPQGPVGSLLSTRKAPPRETASQPHLPPHAPATSPDGMALPHVWGHSLACITCPVPISFSSWSSSYEMPSLTTGLRASWSTPGFPSFTTLCGPDQNKSSEVLAGPPLCPIVGSR